MRVFLSSPFFIVSSSGFTSTTVNIASGVKTFSSTLYCAIRLWSCDPYHHTIQKDPRYTVDKLGAAQGSLYTPITQRDLALALSIWAAEPTTPRSPRRTIPPWATQPYTLQIGNARKKKYSLHAQGCIVKSDASQEAATVQAAEDAELKLIKSKKSRGIMVCHCRHISGVMHR